MTSGGIMKSTINNLSNSSEENYQLGDIQKALLNILEDSNAEKLRMEATLKAMINILSDYSEEKNRLDDVQKAFLNILEDFDVEEDKLRVRTIELQAADAELKRSNADLQQFAYVASHDLQEPLRAVTGFLTLLAKKQAGNLDLDSQTYITHAVDGAHRMRALVNDLLTYARVDSRGKELGSVKLAKVLERVKTDLSVQIEENAAQIISGELPAVMGDSTQITQLFQNLIGNAIKFRSSQAPEIRIMSTPQKDDWLFSVQDNGLGFEMEHAERIFVIFQRLQGREQASGTGIGLALCKKIVERHNGKIWVESKPGEGSTFYFTLPQSIGDA